MDPDRLGVCPMSGFLFVSSPPRSLLMRRLNGGEKHREPSPTSSLLALRWPAMSWAGARKRLDKQSPTRHATTRRKAPVLATPWPRAATEASGGPDGAGSPIDGKIGNLPSQSGHLHTRGLWCIQDRRPICFSTDIDLQVFSSGTYNLMAVGNSGLHCVLLLSFSHCSSQLRSQA
ncbi:uncharacterized protein [Lolium perenne]|uniref:uncharacterized protein isoform X2 n=1 Tax=Lolium perenne TaxID=4522 RepID=UPI0021F6404E|nr:uncharacterized protein LOC127333594 isoform X2 [Lolium perenne]